LTRHSDRVTTAVAFEPPLARLLPDGQHWLDVFTDTYRHYRRNGVPTALARFREQAFPEVDRQLMQRANAATNTESAVEVNAVHWLENELRQYPAVQLDMPKLTEGAPNITLLAGRESRGYPAYQATTALADVLGLSVLELPGGHLGHLIYPTDFAQQIDAQQTA